MHDGAARATARAWFPRGRAVKDLLGGISGLSLIDGRRDPGSNDFVLVIPARAGGAAEAPADLIAGRLCPRPTLTFPRSQRLPGDDSLGQTDAGRPGLPLHGKVKR
jgi:hypothetical protein